ncbi:MAG: lytic transglycosylase domain-containing protein [Paracoccaceae bacterium]
MQVAHRWISVFCVVFSGFITPVHAQNTLAEIRPRPLGWALEAVRRSDWDSADAIAVRDGPVAQDVITWQRLLAGEGSYADVHAFLARRMDWPDLQALRKASEPSIIDQPDATILEFFETAAAQTATGALRHAAALIRAGNPSQAGDILRAAFTNFPMSAEEQAQYLSDYPHIVTPLIPDRLDAMLWRGWQDNAAQIQPLADADHQALARARVALQRSARNVDTALAAVPKALSGHSGLAHARFEWRVRKGRWADAKQLLLERSASVELLGNPARWANRRRALARDEMRDGTAERAYQLATQHYLSEGSHYADLEWLAGYIALTRLNEPKRALEHFENHDAAVASPISQGRAGYWKGRAHRALGDFAAADQEFTNGAAHQSSFYGLLAAEAAGLPFDVGLPDAPTERWEESPIVSDSLFQAGLLLIASGERSLAERFWVHLARQLGEHDAALLGQAAIDLSEPHLAVMIGKAVARRGVIVPKPYYPLHPLAQADLPVSAELALAIARRESEFDPVVVSGVGARGLMQLMPATAKEVAGQLGLAKDHSTARLTADPVYNGILGTQYLADLNARFKRNIIMVSAAYNAGPSRPERWMRLFGDPRGGDIEAIVDWIENIPFRETRNYVMRVSESLPIFRARLGKDPLPVPFSQELLGRSPN